jgi:anti-sigma B factor antagonist
VADVSDNNGPLTLSVTERDGSVEVTAQGEVDIHTCQQLQDTLVSLASNGARTITLDLAKVAFIDSSGLRALVVGHKALEEHGGTLVVANPSTIAARLLEVTGLDGLFGGTPST